MKVTELGIEKIANDTTDIANRIILFGTDSTDEYIEYDETTTLSDLTEYIVFNIDATRVQIEGDTIKFEGFIPEDLTSSKIISLLGLCQDNDLISISETESFSKNSSYELSIIYWLQYKNQMDPRKYKILSIIGDS